MDHGDRLTVFEGYAITTGWVRPAYIRRTSNGTRPTLEASFVVEEDRAIGGKYEKVRGTYV